MSQWSFPEIGLAEAPISPTMRADTVTNRKLKTTTRTEAIKLPLTPGLIRNASTAHTDTVVASDPPKITLPGSSLSVRMGATR